MPFINAYSSYSPGRPLQWEWTYRWLVRHLKVFVSFLHNYMWFLCRECQHRWPEVTGMVDFYNRVGNSELNHWVNGTNQQIAFGRGTYCSISRPAFKLRHMNQCFLLLGSIGYVVINNDSSNWDNKFATLLPDGNYCDVVSGPTTAKHCSGKTCVAVFYSLLIFVK